MIYIENEGALFRSQGFMTECPDELYSRKQSKWVPYTGETPKPQGWGERISEQEAQAMIAQISAAPAGQAAAPPSGPPPTQPAAPPPTSTAA